MHYCSKRLQSNSLPTIVFIDTTHKHTNTLAHAHAPALILICRLIKSKAHAVWFDNFSHAYASQMQNVAIGAYKSCLWTGEGWMEFQKKRAWHKYHPNCTGTDNLLLRRNAVVRDLNDPLGTFPAMPPFLRFQPDYEGVEDSKEGKLLHDLAVNIDAEGAEMFESSICRTFNVVRVPLKPDPAVAKRLGKKRLARVLSESRDGMTNLRPRKMHDFNVGSNRGLLTMLRYFRDERADQSDDFFSIM